MISKWAPALVVILDPHLHLPLNVLALFAPFTSRPGRPHKKHQRPFPVPRLLTDCDTSFSHREFLLALERDIDSCFADVERTRLHDERPLTTERPVAISTYHHICKLHGEKGFPSEASTEHHHSSPPPR
jgi:hypothetical protein